MDPRIAAECRQIDRVVLELLSKAQRRKQREPNTSEIATVISAAEKRLRRDARQHDDLQKGHVVRARLNALLSQLESWLRHRMGPRRD